MKETFVSHFKKVLNKEKGFKFNKEDLKNLVKFRLSPNMAYSLVSEVLEEKIKKFIFTLDNNKALGPNRYGFYFFK